MNYADWYTDTVDVYRDEVIMDGDLTRHERRIVMQDIPCRVYQSDSKSVTMDQASASVKQESNLACDNSVAICTGDEFIVHRGALLGEALFSTRAFAGEPHYYFEPFGAVIPGLAHQEIKLMQEERVK